MMEYYFSGTSSASTNYYRLENSTSTDTTISFYEELDSYITNISYYNDTPPPEVVIKNKIIFDRVKKIGKEKRIPIQKKQTVRLTCRRG